MARCIDAVERIGRWLHGYEVMNELRGSWTPIPVFVNGIQISGPTPLASGLQSTGPTPPMTIYYPGDSRVDSGK